MASQMKRVKLTSEGEESQNAFIGETATVLASNVSEETPAAPASDVAASPDANVRVAQAPGFAPRAASSMEATAAAPASEKTGENASVNVDKNVSASTSVAVSANANSGEVSASSAAASRAVPLPNVADNASSLSTSGDEGTPLSAAASSSQNQKIETVPARTSDVSTAQAMTELHPSAQDSSEEDDDDEPPSEGSTAIAGRANEPSAGVDEASRRYAAPSLVPPGSSLPHPGAQSAANGGAAAAPTPARDPAQPESARTLPPDVPIRILDCHLMKANYIRTRNSNLRCFPHCSRVHMDRSFCGSTVPVLVRPKPGMNPSNIAVSGEILMEQTAPVASSLIDTPLSTAIRAIQPFGGTLLGRQADGVFFEIHAPRKWRYDTTSEGPFIFRVTAVDTSTGLIFAVDDTPAFKIIPAWRVKNPSQLNGVPSSQTTRNVRQQLPPDFMQHHTAAQYLPYPGFIPYVPGIGAMPFQSPNMFSSPYHVGAMPQGNYRTPGIPPYAAVPSAAPSTYFYPRPSLEQQHVQQGMSMHVMQQQHQQMMQQQELQMQQQQQQQQAMMAGQSSDSDDAARFPRDHLSYLKGRMTSAMYALMANASNTRSTTTAPPATDPSLFTNTLPFLRYPNSAPAAAANGRALATANPAVSPSNPS